MRPIDADEAKKNCERITDPYAVMAAKAQIDSTETIDAIPIHCKIGQVVYGIRNYKGISRVQKGFVSEMFFTKDMKLMIVVKHVCRGEWLEKVFPTYESAEAAIRKDGNENGR